MRVSLDAISLATPRTGVGHYTFELACHLALLSPGDEFELVSPFPPAPPASGSAEQTLPVNLRALYPKVNSLTKRWFAVGLPLYLKKSRSDLFHGTNYEVPLWANCPTVLTIHDLSLFLHPETHEKRLVRRGRRRLPIMARAASLIITPSESVRREVCEHLGAKPTKVIAVPEAAREIFHPMPKEETDDVRRKLEIEDQFILCVGTIEPRKNLVTLLRALEEIRSSTSHRPQLVISGRKGWLTEELFAYAGRAGFENHVRFTGYLSDEQLCGLYSSCRVFVYPSLYEGFGLPPLEAMACGAAVITSRIPSIVETVGDAARLITPTDHRALAQAIIELLENENERLHLSSAGVERARRFSWKETARLTLDVYAELLKTKST